MLNFICRSDSIYCKIKSVPGKFRGYSKPNSPATPSNKCDTIHDCYFSIKWMECRPNIFFPSFQFLFRQVVLLLPLLSSPTEMARHSPHVLETIPTAL